MLGALCVVRMHRKLIDHRLDQLTAFQKYMRVFGRRRFLNRDTGFIRPLEALPNGSIERETSHQSGSSHEGAPRGGISARRFGLVMRLRTSLGGPGQALASHRFLP